MFFSQKLKKFKNIKHCFFSRKNGISKGYYESLNCGLGSKDQKKNVLKNLELVSSRMGCKKEFLITLNQKHTNQVNYFENEKSVENKLKGDAIVTKVKNIGISILSADCSPIIFYDPKNKIIGCAHSGWKGALNGIIKNTVKKFNELNSNNNDLIAVVGPCLSKKNYEVKKDFLKTFISQDKNNEVFFQKISNEKYFFDLRGFINNQISRLNIRNVENVRFYQFNFIEKSLL